MVVVGQHLFGITTLDQAPPDKGAQDTSTQVSLRLGHDSLVDSTGRVKNDARRGGFGIGIGIGIGVARHHLKHPIDHADMEVHMLIQAGAEPVTAGAGDGSVGR